jgi:hypothetical protein
MNKTGKIKSSQNEEEQKEKLNKFSFHFPHKKE